MATKTPKATIERTISYRRCIINPKNAQTLQQLVSAALTLKPKAVDRMEPMNAQSSELRCIGNFATVNNCLCGYLTAFERGASQPVIDDHPTATTLSLDMLAPSKKAGVQQQFVPGVVYFAIHENHVAIVQSASLRASGLESHLSWLLKERTNQLVATSSFALSDEAQKATKEKIKKSHVKKIAFGQPMMAEVQAHDQKSLSSGNAGVQNSTKASTKFKPVGPVVELIKSFFTEDASFETLGLNGIFDGNLEVWIEVRYPPYTRSKGEDAIALMDTLGVALRDIEADQVRLELEDGSKVKGQELKISSTLDVEIRLNKLPNEQKLWESMGEWLTTQLENGVVDP